MRGLLGIIRKADGFWRRVNRVAAIISAVVLLGMMLLVVCDALGRSVLLMPIPGAVEGTGLLMPYIIFFAFAYTLVVGGHVRVSLLLDRLPARFQLRAEVLACIIGVAFFGILTYYGWIHFWESFVIREFMMAPIKLPWWVGKLAMPIGLFIMSVQFLFLLLGYIAELVTGKKG
ncbi:hypothetical protein ES703_65329 [subsurface metagenome]